MLRSSFRAPAGIDPGQPLQPADERHEPASVTSANATSATISACRKRCGVRLDAVLCVVVFNTSLMSERDASHAGTTPKITPVRKSAAKRERQCDRIQGDANTRQVRELTAGDQLRAPIETAEPRAFHP